VTRATTSVLVALLLVFILLGGPCLACARVIAGGLNHDCCPPQKGCQQQPSGSLAGCISPAVDLAKVEQASAYVFVSPSVIDKSWNLDVQTKQSYKSLVPPGSIPHSPPDLCLLNSVLTI
jgi:hypothetical protein